MSTRSDQLPQDPAEPASMVVEMVAEIDRLNAMLACRKWSRLASTMAWRRTGGENSSVAILIQSAEGPRVLPRVSR